MVKRSVTVFFVNVTSWGHSVCWIHLLGITRSVTGGVGFRTGFTGQSTILDYPFFRKIMKTDFLTTLRKVMVVVLEHQHQKSWTKYESTLEQVTVDPSTSRTSVWFDKVCPT